MQRFRETYGIKATSVREGPVLLAEGAGVADWISVGISLSDRLSKLSVPGRPNSRAKVYCACSKCGCCCLDLCQNLSLTDWVSFQYQGVLIVGQGSIAFAVGASGVVSFIFSFSLSGRRTV